MNRDRKLFTLGVCAVLTAIIVVAMQVERAGTTEEVPAPTPAEIEEVIDLIIPSEQEEPDETGEVFYVYEAENPDDYITINRINFHRNSTWIDLSDMNLSCEDIIPLQYMVNLTEINMWGYNRVVDLSPLAELTKLTVLQIGGNPVVDITPLANLTELVELRASGCNIIDLTPLANLTKMRHLTLRENNINDISPLENLKELTTLRLNDNPITDWSPVAHVVSVDGRPSNWEG
jgi:hypothetical protein